MSSEGFQCNWKRIKLNRKSHCRARVPSLPQQLFLLENTFALFRIIRFVLFFRRWHEWTQGSVTSVCTCEMACALPWQQAWLHPQRCSARSVERGAHERHSKSVQQCISHALDTESADLGKTAWAAAVHLVQHFGLGLTHKGLTSALYRLKQVSPKRKMIICDKMVIWSLL